MEDFKGVRSSLNDDVFIRLPDVGGDVEVETGGDTGRMSVWLTEDNLVAYLRGLGYTVEKPGEKPTLYWLRHDNGAHLSETAEGDLTDAPYSAWRRLNRARSYDDLGAKVEREVNDVSFSEAVRQIVAWAEADGFLVPPIPADILEFMEA